jgi:uncharacterized membrane protein
MPEPLIEALLWAGVLGAGLMAGVYFAFSSFVMAALAGLPEGQGAAAMRAVNRVILRSAFMPLFFGTTLLAALLALAGALRWDAPGAAPLLAGGLLYLLGMFGCTVAFNVPLNRRLDRQLDRQGQAHDDEGVWADYLVRWTRRNHLRTLASAASCLLFVWALAAG